MVYSIQKMNKMRRRILWGILLGTIIAFAIFMYPSLASIYLRIRARWFYLVFSAAVISLSGFILFALFRSIAASRKTRKPPVLRAGEKTSAVFTVISLIDLFLLVHIIIGKLFGYAGWSYIYLNVGLVSWFVLCFIILALYGRYRMILKRDPEIRSAVNDERIRYHWLRAYRTSFFALIGVALIWKLSEMSFSSDLLFGRLQLPDGPWLIFFFALISPIASFLLYNREDRDE